MGAEGAEVAAAVAVRAAVVQPLRANEAKPDRANAATPGRAEVVPRPRDAGGGAGSLAARAVRILRLATTNPHRSRLAARRDVVAAGVVAAVVVAAVPAAASRPHHDRGVRILVF